MELLWALAARSPYVVLEANFRPHSPRERARIAGLARPLVEVHCACPAAECARRYAARAAHAHPTHVLKTLSLEDLAEYDGPVGPGPVVTVDTTRPVDIAAVAREVRARLQDQPGPHVTEVPARPPAPPNPL